jgi:hypothetical protein
MLKLVPKADPPPAEKVRRRIRRFARPDGALMCNRCGSQTVMTATSGVIIKNGRKTGGTVIEKDVCAICYRKGIFSPMMPELQRIK